MMRSLIAILWLGVLAFAFSDVSAEAAATFYRMPSLALMRWMPAAADDGGPLARLVHQEHREEADPARLAKPRGAEEGVATQELGSRHAPLPLRHEPADDELSVLPAGHDEPGFVRGKD